MQNIITNTVVHLGCNDMQAHRQKEQEWIRSGECQFPRWNQITAKQVKIFSMDFFSSFLKAQYQMGIMEILEPKS